MGAIYVRGELVSVNAPTTTYREIPELSFPKLRHRAETRSVVWHHTGGENGAAGVHATLVARDLSVHFLIDNHGRIHQYADTEARCSHAGSANGYSIGVEIANRANKVPFARGVKRALVIEEIHGVEMMATTFLPAQVTSAIALAEALSAAYDLPMAVPMFGAHVHAGLVPPAELATFRGHLGHFHVSAKKRDPGLVLMEAIAARSVRGREGAAE
jgi:N-acetyl-anhydromuramyl-L-alanine amidase AmpD